MCALYIVFHYYDSSSPPLYGLHSSISVFFVYTVGLYLRDKLKNIYGFIKVFGQSSYYIYLMHPLVLTIMIIFAEKNFLSVTQKILLYTFTVIPLTVISCLAYTLIRNKLRN